MHIQILKENLQTAVGIATRFSAQKAQLPILTHLAFDASKDGIYLAGTDLDKGVRMRVAGKVVEKGSFAVPAKLLSELVQSLPLGAVKLQVDDKEQLRVEAGNIKASIQGMRTEDYPDMAFLKQEFELVGTYDQADLAWVEERIGFAVSRDDTRPVLTGVLWEVAGQKMVATDGYRLSVVEGVKARGAGKQPKLTIIVPGELLREGMRVIGETGAGKVEVYYQPEKKELVLEGDDVRIFGRVLEGQFPEYSAIMPADFKVLAKMQAKELLDAVKAAAIFARESANIVRLAVDAKSVRVSANAPQVGQNVVTVESTLERGKEGVIAFNSRYLIDYLAHVQAKEIEFGMNEALRPGVFREGGKGRYVHVIMPVRVREAE